MSKHMRFAYADPPYLGCGAKLYGAHHEDAAIWDGEDAHARLIERLCDEFTDGWALSLHTPSLKTMLNLCPDDVRIGSWVKPFAVFKPNVGVAYAWEPLIFRGGRKRTREQPTVRDWVAENITLKKGLPGAKPAGFVHWVLDLLNAQEGDEVVDVFPGTGGCMAVMDARLSRPAQLTLTA